MHPRAAGDKATDLPQLQKIVHMQAAGWGGVGTVAACQSLDVAAIRRSPRQSSSPMYGHSMSIDACASMDLDTGDLWQPVRERIAHARPATASPRKLLEVVRGALHHPSDLDALARALDRQALPPDVTRTVLGLVDCGLTHEQAWLLLVAWLVVRFGTRELPGAAAQAAIDSLRAGPSPQSPERGMQSLAHPLGPATLDGWSAQDADEAMNMA